VENVITILNSQRQKVGDAKAALCGSLQELTENFVIHNFTGGLAHYESQFPYADYWPIFAFNDIWIERPHRRAGIGSRAFNEIADHYQELGARLGLLRLGTQGDPFEEGIAWRTTLDSKLGWVVLQHHAEESATIPLMCLPMKHRTLTSAKHSRLIEVLERDSSDSLILLLPEDPITLPQTYEGQTGAEPNGPPQANGSQPIRLETNRASSAAGSRRLPR